MINELTGNDYAAAGGGVAVAFGNEQSACIDCVAGGGAVEASSETGRKSEEGQRRRLRRR